MTLSADGSTIEASVTEPVAPSYAKRLSGFGDPLPSSELGFLEASLARAFDLSRHSLLLIMQELGARVEHQLQAGPIAGAWRINEGGTRHLSSRATSVAIIAGPPHGALDASSVQHIRSVAANNESPLIAFEFLRQAFAAEDHRVAWIQAAAAAEIGIKEALVIIEPRVEKLILEVPAPPVAKLYGPLLEHYSGKPSPHRSALDRGAYRRNQLVHRPERHHVTEKDRNAYLYTVRAALFDLLGRIRKRTPRA